MHVLAKGTSVTRFIEFAKIDFTAMSKWIKFTDVGMGEGTLDQYLLGRSVPVAGSRGGKFRPIGTCDNEVCMFPASATVRLCTIVASLFAKSLSTHAYDSTPLVEQHQLVNRNVREETGETEVVSEPTPILDRRRMSVADRRMSVADRSRDRKRSSAHPHELQLLPETIKTAMNGQGERRRSTMHGYKETWKDNDKWPPL